MTTELTVQIYEDVDDPGWQLHVRPGPGAHCLLFGWSIPPWHVDAGPPSALWDSFAAALVTCGSLAFLEAARRDVRRTGWFTDAGDAWLAVPPSLGDRLRMRHPPWFRITDSAEHAGRLFCGSVSWDMQLQIGLLIRRDRRPMFDRAFLLKLLLARRADVADLQLPDDVLALALPAVDGAFLEIVARTPQTRDTIRQAIGIQCERRSIAHSSQSWTRVHSGDPSRPA